MARRLDWERARRRDRQRLAKVRSFKPKRQKDEERQRFLQAFADKHALACFSCHSGEGKRWATSGWNRRGPWIICVPCVARNKQKKSSPPTKVKVPAADREKRELIAQNEHPHKRQKVSREQPAR